MPREDWGIAVVGLGGIAQQHLEGYRRQGLKVVGGTDVDENRRQEAAQKWGFPVTEGAEELISRPDVKVVDINVPHLMELRRPLVEIAARHGKAILIQKPLMPFLEDAKALVEIAESANVPMMVNQNSLFAPQSLLIEPYLPEIPLRAVAGERCSDDRQMLGQPYYCQIENRGWMDPTGHSWVGKSSRWITSDMAIHHFAMVRHWFGDAESVAALMPKDSSQAGVVAETVSSVMIRFKNGVSALVLNNWSYRGPRHRPHANEEIVIQGNGGSLTADAGAVQIVSSSGERQHTVEGTWFPDAFGRSMAHYVDALDAGRPFLCEGRDNLKTLAIVDAAYRSAAERREIPLTEVL